MACYHYTVLSFFGNDLFTIILTAYHCRVWDILCILASYANPTGPGTAEPAGLAGDGSTAIYVHTSKSALRTPATTIDGSKFIHSTLLVISMYYLIHALWQIKRWLDCHEIRTPTSVTRRPHPGESLQR